MADIDGEGFLDFFAPPSLSNGGSHINSTFNAYGSFAAFHHPPPPDAADNDDDDWGDFTGPASNPPPGSTSNAFDPFGFADSGSGGHVEPELNRICSDSKGIVFEKPRGPLPLSLFGEDEEEGGSGVESSLDASVPSDFKISSEIPGNLNAQSLEIKLQGASNSETNGLHTAPVSETYPNGTNQGSDDEDDWEFHGAFSQNGGGEKNAKEEGGSGALGSKGESTVVISQDQKAGQDAFNFSQNNIKSTSSYQFADLFTSQNGVSNRNSEVNIGTDFNTTVLFPDASNSAPLANDSERRTADVPYSEYTNDDFDDFGQFVDATSVPENHWQPFSESVISNNVVKSDSNDQNVTVNLTFASKNGSTIQGSETNVQDLISHLYTQGQHTNSADSSKKPAENGLSAIHKTVDLSYNDSWDFNNGFGVKEKSSGVVQKEPVKLQDLQFFIDFFARLGDKLRILASRLLEDADSSEAQEAHKALHDDMGSEFHLEQNISISGCLTDIIEDLHTPTFQIIETEYLLSGRLTLAENDWKMAIALLKETTLIGKILKSGPASDQISYISTWSNILDVCAQELKHGASIWKQAVANNLQIQILSDTRGQCYIQALGEIYRIVQLLGLSVHVYKPWMLLNKGSESKLFTDLKEASTLWSSSGLEEAFWNLLGSVDSASARSVEALLESIKHIQEIDVPAVQDCVVFQQRDVCQLSLLPEQMLPGLKLVSWNEMRCFLKIANCWENLISHEPPVLPQLRFG